MHLAMLSRERDEMNSRYEQQMKKGVLEMLVLKLLSQDEKYGYQLINELKNSSEGLFSMKEGTLYPILYRLEEDQLVSSRWNEPKGKEVSRKYYSITEKGKQVLSELNQLWHQLSNGVSSVMEDTYHQLWRNCIETRSIGRLHRGEIKPIQTEKTDIKEE